MGRKGETKWEAPSLIKVKAFMMFKNKMMAPNLSANMLRPKSSMNERYAGCKYEAIVDLTV